MEAMPNFHQEAWERSSAQIGVSLAEMLGKQAVVGF